LGHGLGLLIQYDRQDHDDEHHQRDGADQPPARPAHKQVGVVCQWKDLK
jgi:hypothetical protein